jgi:hypothetical protein
MEVPACDSLLKRVLASCYRLREEHVSFQFVCPHHIGGKELGLSRCGDRA